MRFSFATIFAILCFAGLARAQNGAYSSPASGGSAFQGAAGTSYQDAAEIAAPANPGSGIDRLWLDSTSHQLNCHTSAGSSCLPSVGSAAWSSLANPTGNISLTMGADTSLFTFNATTGAGVDLFKLTDTLNNTGTGAILHVTTASGSAALPIQFDANGNGLKLSTAGLLTKVGTGALDVASLSGAINLAASGGGGVTGILPEANMAATTVYTDQNATFGAHTYDFSGVTLIKLRVAAGLTTAANGAIGYDSTNNNWHGWNNAADLIFPMVPGATPVNLDCVNWVVSSGNIRLGDTGSACGTSSGFANPMTTLGDIIYENSTPAAARLAGCTLAVGVPCVFSETPTTGPTAGAPGWSLAGIPVNNNSETTCATQTLNILDRATAIFCSGGSTSTVTLPVHTTSGFGLNFPFVIYNGNSGNMTLSPTTDTIDNGTLLPKWISFLYNNASGNWQSNQVPSFAAFGSTCANGVTWSTTANFGCLSAAPVKSGDTAGGDLSGTYPNPTVAKINGGSVPASAFCVATNSSSQLIACTPADTTFTNATTAITANSCSASAVTVTMTGLTTSMAVIITPSTDVSASTGWGGTGGLVIDAWPSAANTLSYKICNQTASSITPAAVTWNVGAR